MLVDPNTWIYEYIEQVYFCILVNMRQQTEIIEARRVGLVFLLTQGKTMSLRENIDFFDKSQSSEMVTNSLNIHSII